MEPNVYFKVSRSFCNASVDRLGLCFHSVSVLPQKLEDALVCPEGQQADVLRQRQRGEAERNHRHPSCQVRFLGSSISQKNTQTHNPFFTVPLFKRQKLHLWGLCTVCVLAGRSWIIMKRRTLWTLWQMRGPIRCLLSHQRMQGVGEQSSNKLLFLYIWVD